jgi:hypothetical protein
MGKVEVQQIAGFLVECQEALYEWDSADRMTLYLHRLYEVSQQIRAAVPDRNDWDVRFALVLAARKTRRLRQEIERRLGVRN